MVILAAQYGYVILVAITFSLECLIIGFAMPNRVRTQVFTLQFMKQNFGEQHLKAFNEEIKASGYPDTGSGLYSHKLSYGDWYKFNNAQRAHLNFVQWIASSLIFLLAGGIYFPIIAAAFGLAMIIGRAIYAAGYAMSGPHGRLIGVLLNDFMVLGLLILSYISAIYMILGQ